MAPDSVSASEPLPVLTQAIALGALLELPMVTQGTAESPMSWPRAFKTLSQSGHLFPT